MWSATPIRHAVSAPVRRALPSARYAQRLWIAEHGLARFRGRDRAPDLGVARRGAEGACEQHQLTEFDHRAAWPVARWKREEPARQFVDPPGQYRRLAVDQPRRDPPAARGHVVDKSGKAHAQLIADPLFECVECIKDRALGILASLGRRSFTTRRILRVLDRFRFGLLRGAQILVGGRRNIRRGFGGAGARPPSAEPVADPGRRIGRGERRDRFRLHPQQSEHVLAWKFPRRAGAFVAEIAQIGHHAIRIGAGARAFAPNQGAVVARANPRPFGRLGEPRRCLERGLIGGELLDRFQINRHAVIRTNPSKEYISGYIGRQ